MSLGLIAKDSIVDLVSLGNNHSDDVVDKIPIENTTAEQDGSGKILIQPTSTSISTTNGNGNNNNSNSSGNGSSTSASVANPQQAQEEVLDRSNKSRSERGGRTQQQPKASLSYGQYAGFKVDYDQQYYNNNNNSYYHTAADYHHNYDHFNNYNYNYNSYHHDSYSPYYLGESQKPISGSIRGVDGTPGGGGGFLCCFFPWLNASSGRNEAALIAAAVQKQREQQQQQDFATRSTDDASTDNRSRDEDETSNASDALGEKLSVRERQAVLARLGLAQPDDPSIDKPGTPSGRAAATTSASSDGAASGDSIGSNGSKTTKKGEKGLLNGIPTYDTSPLEQLGPTHDDENQADGTGKALRGILKNKSSANMKQNTAGGGVNGGTSSRDKDSAAGARRSLFPTYDKPTSKPRILNSVSFAPMARVVTVKSQRDMTIDEKGDVWWQKTDYEDFRRTGRIITQAILQGGSEIWLAANESWKQSPKDSRSVTLKTVLSLSDENRKDSTESINDTGEKWWHAFGHSRRGLEHVVSIEEGQQRQLNVRHAIQAVVDEQTRQKLYRREDPDKLRMVSINHTSWARDLALAAAASDADAVKTSFAEDRKSREFYLLKMALHRNPNTTSMTTSGMNANRRLPEFMQPAVKQSMLMSLSAASSASSVSSSVSATSSSSNPNVRAQNSNLRLQNAQRLDANTAAQIRYRRQQKTQQAAAAAASAGASSSSTTTNTTAAATQSTSSQQESSSTTTTASSEPIHDPDTSERTSLASRAAGFSAVEGKTNMAAVLSGMGAVSK